MVNVELSPFLPEIVTTFKYFGAEVSHFPWNLQLLTQALERECLDENAELHELLKLLLERYVLAHPPRRRYFTSLMVSFLQERNKVKPSDSLNRLLAFAEGMDTEVSYRVCPPMDSELTFLLLSELSQAYLTSRDTMDTFDLDDQGACLRGIKFFESKGKKATTLMYFGWDLVFRVSGDDGVSQLVAKSGSEMEKVRASAGRNTLSAELLQEVRAKIAEFESTKRVADLMPSKRSSVAKLRARDLQAPPEEERSITPRPTRSRARLGNETPETPSRVLQANARAERYERRTLSNGTVDLSVSDNEDSDGPTPKKLKAEEDVNKDADVQVLPTQPVADVKPTLPQPENGDFKRSPPSKRPRKQPKKKVPDNRDSWLKDFHYEKFTMEDRQRAQNSRAARANRRLNGGVAPPLIGLPVAPVAILQPLPEAPVGNNEPPSLVVHADGPSSSSNGAVSGSQTPTKTSGGSVGGGNNHPLVQGPEKTVNAALGANNESTPVQSPKKPSSAPVDVDKNRPPVNSPTKISSAPVDVDKNRPPVNSPTKNSSAPVDVDKNRPPVESPQKNPSAPVDVDKKHPPVESPQKNPSAVVDVDKKHPPVDSPQKNPSAAVDVDKKHPPVDSPTKISSAPVDVDKNRPPVESPTKNSSAPVDVDKNRPPVESPTKNSSAPVDVDKNRSPALSPTKTASADVGIDNNSPPVESPQKNPSAPVDVDKNRPPVQIPTQTVSAAAGVDINRSASLSPKKISSPPFSVNPQRSASYSPRKAFSAAFAQTFYHYKTQKTNGKNSTNPAQMTQALAIGDPRFAHVQAPDNAVETNNQSAGDKISTPSDPIANGTSSAVENIQHS